MKIKFEFEEINSFFTQFYFFGETFEVADQLFFEDRAGKIQCKLEIPSIWHPQIIIEIWHADDVDFKNDNAKKFAVIYYLVCDDLRVVGKNYPEIWGYFKGRHVFGLRTEPTPMVTILRFNYDFLDILEE